MASQQAKFHYQSACQSSSRKMAKQIRPLWRLSSQTTLRCQPLPSQSGSSSSLKASDKLKPTPRTERPSSPRPPLPPPSTARFPHSRNNNNPLTSTQAKPANPPPPVSEAQTKNQAKSQPTTNGTSKKAGNGTQSQPPQTTGKAPPPKVESPSAGSTSSSSSPPAGAAAKPAGKAKKNKKKNKNGDLSGVDEIFMPRPQNELDGLTDEFDRELEEFKRFCLDTQQPRERRKIPVNVNLKDIFKKKTALV